MLRITKESEYAFLLLSALLAEDDTPKSATALAEMTGIAGPMTGKVLKRLVRFNILSSTRGSRGGYTLARPAENISALQVVEAMEGAPELVDCAHGECNCAFADFCTISPFWQQLNDDIQSMLAAKSLADMQRDERRVRTQNQTIQVPIKNIRA
ncbi:SUF system Fe-S cluster assembly regulator [Suttonella ornithocola]|uniref:HTH-type transcriptional repressor NsrR n=1 Tax=Suttonella ornithocola TaxID=279832 RepID=A0A380MXY6_9GAMM|nr:SUF system Fe-S cluster assembly regulator [Suttonella ornithocola]SUO96297.1 HTH-type transcriptional repressor NsrR [Suttonella ornithocola]